MAERSLTPRLALAGAALALSLTACARREPSLADYQAPLVVQGANPGLIANIQSARNVQQRSVRVVEIFDSAGVQTLAYREEFLADGAGRFSLQPIEALTPVDPAWSIRQGVRQGYLARYRDFEIRDTALFALNWKLTDLSETSTVAGRPCSRYFVERKSGSGHTYLIDVDLTTGVPLAYEDRDELGVLAARMTYESFDETPDLSGAVWFQESVTETELSSGSSASLRQQVGFQVPLPRLIPAGYYLDSTSSLVVGGGQSWVKLVFSDGVEPLFYLFRPLFDPLQSTAITNGSFPTSVSPQTANPSNEIFLYRMGTAGVAQGTFSPGTLIAVGRLSDATLGDVIESALP